MKNTEKNKKTIIILFIIGITFLAYGIFRNDFNEIYNKARIICLECIGIG